MAKEDYIPVTADDWYQRRRQDAEGEFFRKVASQGPRKGEGGNTRQGIYCLTADGQLLAYKNAGQAPEVMRDVLQQALAAWRKLPEARRKPGDVKIEPQGKLDPHYARTLPQGGAILNVYTRILDKDATGGWCAGTCPTPGGASAARDRMWLTAGEVKALLPMNAKTGDRFTLPASIAERLLRFHLIDNTRGEPPLWAKEDIRRADLQLIVESLEGKEARLRLEGTALLATSSDPTMAERGFEARLTGWIEGDVSRGQLTRLEWVAVGDHWGEGTFTRNARAGRKPLGVVLELATSREPADLVPPQGARELREYFGAARP